MVLTTRRLFSALFFISLFVLSVRNVTDPDFGWHLRTGEYIVSTLSIPHTDFFSFTATGQPWITHEWLTQVVMYLLYRVGGLGALSLFFALVATLAFALLYERCEGRPFVAAFVLLLAAITAAPFWGARPHTLSLLLASLFLYILDRYRRTGNGRLLLSLVPLMLIWANSHGSFALGPVLVGTYLVGDWGDRLLQLADGSRSQPPPTRSGPSALGPLPFAGSTFLRTFDKRLAAVLVICIAVIALNPNGLVLYAYPFQTVTSQAIQTYIQEWQSPDFASRAVLPFVIFLVALFGGLVLAPPKMRLTDLILLGAFTYASFRGARQISVWVFVAAPLLSAVISAVVKANVGREEGAGTVSPRRGLVALNWVLLVLVLLAAAGRVAQMLDNQPQAEKEYFPVNAVNVIADQRWKGPIFNQYNWGGYLIWRMYPQERVFIDGRSDLYGLTEDFVVREYLKAYRGDPDWWEPIQRYGVNLVLVEPTAPLVVQLERDANWKSVYIDDQSVIYKRE